jgi:thiol-disulfide isomerase/thioredoxin
MVYRSTIGAREAAPYADGDWEPFSSGSYVRKLLISAIFTALAPVPYSFAQAQDPAQAGSQPTVQSIAKAGSAAAPAVQATADNAGPDQPMSVADLARLARAKKQGDATPKATKLVLDDDNMPRGSYADAPSSSGSASGNASGSAAASAGGPFPEYRGKVVLVDFWASWCGPCRNALPNLKRLQSAYSGDDFVVVSISEDDDEAGWRAFTASHQMTWPQRLDSDGSLQHQFGVQGLPTYVLIGRDGTVVQKIVGEDPARSIMERLGPEIKKSLAAGR